MKFLILLFIISISLTLNAQNNSIHSQRPAKPAAGSSQKANYTFKLFTTGNSGWGYDIFMGKRLLIHQPIIPGMQGNNGFPDKTAAGKAARLAIKHYTQKEPSNNSKVPQTGNTWLQKADVGGLGRYGGVGFSIGGKGYIGLGNSCGGGAFSCDFWEYDTASDAWTQKADYAGLGRVNALGFSVGSKGYVGTGDGLTCSYNDFWEFDPSANTWIQKTNVPGGARNGAVAISIGDKGYIGTGNPEGGLFLADFWEYNPSTDSWTQKADFAGSPRVNAAGLSIGNKGYIGCGYADTGDLTNDFWEYDPETDTWTQKTSFSGISRYGAACFSIGNRGYMGTGFSFGIGYLSDFYEYNPGTDSWTQIADFGGGNRGAAVSFCIGKFGYLGTGNNDSFESDFWQYEPSCIPPEPPVNTTATSGQTICTGHSTTLSASGQGILGWYTAAIGGNWLGSGNSYTTPVLETSTTFYVQDSTCGAGERTGIQVSVNPLPGQAGPISGLAQVCAGQHNVAYSINPVSNAVSYTWLLPPGATLSSGGSTEITLDFAENAVSGNLEVYANNSCGIGIASPAFPVMVNPVPAEAVISNQGDTLFSNTPFGNQWYFEGYPLEDDTMPILIAGKSGDYWDVITLNSCASGPSNHIFILKTGIEMSLPASIRVYPQPSEGNFRISMANPSDNPYTVTIYNSIGELIYKDSYEINGSVPLSVDLRPIPAGIYQLILESRNKQEACKIIIK